MSQYSSQVPAPDFTDNELLKFVLDEPNTAMADFIRRRGIHPRDTDFEQLRYDMAYAAWKRGLLDRIPAKETR